MAAAERRQKNSKMASDLIKKGYPHGRRMTSPTHNNYPDPQKQIGSAAYRRLIAKQGYRRA